MARDDLFRRSFEAGTAFLGMSRDRAEALVKELVKAGEVQKGKAQKAIDELVERSRKGTEELREFVRREIVDEVSALGLATKADIARLETRIDELTTAGAGAGAAAGPVTPPTPTKAAPVKKAGAAKPAAKRAGKKSSAPRTPAAAPGDAGDGEGSPLMPAPVPPAPDGAPPAEA